MSWSTKRRNSRPSLTNSTRPSPRCPATKKNLLSYKFPIPEFFPSQKLFFEIFAHHQFKSRNFAALLFCTIFPPPFYLSNLYFKTKSFSSVTVVFGCDDIFLCEKLILRAFCQYRSFSIVKRNLRRLLKTFHLFLISRLQFFHRESAN